MHPDSLSKVDLSRLPQKQGYDQGKTFSKSPFESQLISIKIMSDFTIYRNGNCTNTTDAEAEDQMYISVDLEYLRDSNSEYCQETVMCGENYISLRQVLKLKIFNFKRFF